LENVDNKEIREIKEKLDWKAKREIWV